MSVIAIIPARGGSKTVQRKNLLEFGGSSLVANAVKSAVDSKVCDRIIVSTDDEEIAAVAVGAGAEVPFIRPAELAQDDTPDTPVCLHVLETLYENEGAMPDYVVWLRPTSPLRLPEDVNAAVQIAIENGADYVRSVTRAKEHPYWLKQFDGKKLTAFIPGKDERTYYQRQSLPPVFRITGAVDVFKISTLMLTRKLYEGDIYGYEMPPERSIELDDELDLMLIDALMNRGDG